MPVIFLRDLKCFPHSKLRTNNNATLYSINLNDPPVQEMLNESKSVVPALNEELQNIIDSQNRTDYSNGEQKKITAENNDLAGNGIYSLGGCMCQGSGVELLGKGIETFSGKGIDVFGGQIVPYCQTTPEYRMKQRRIVRGLGIGSFFSKAKHKIMNFGKQNIMPFLKASAKTALETAKRVGADVVENVADDVAKAGVNAIEQKFGKNIGTALATQGLTTLGKNARSQATKYVDAQEKAKPYSKVEDKISGEIASRSRAILADLIAKNKPAPAKQSSAPQKKGNGINDQLIL